MKLFELVRLEDATGISGTGVVAQGVQFDSGKCVMQWLTKINSTAVYDSIQDLEAIHGHGGKTVIQWKLDKIEVRKSQLVNIFSNFPNDIAGTWRLINENNETQELIIKGE